VFPLPDFSFSIDDPLYSGAKINIGTDNPPTNILQNYDLGIQTTYTLTLPLPGNSVIYWQIVPYSEFAPHPNPPIWQFTTRSAQPEPVWDAFPDQPLTELIPEGVLLTWEYSDPYTTGFYLCLGTDNPPTLSIAIANI
jgi:hypothetical protein